MEARTFLSQRLSEQPPLGGLFYTLKRETHKLNNSRESERDKKQLAHRVLFASQKRCEKAPSRKCNKASNCCERLLARILLVQWVLLKFEGNSAKNNESSSLLVLCGRGGEKVGILIQFVGTRRR
jgi:hypothetical protein